MDRRFSALSDGITNTSREFLATGMPALASVVAGTPIARVHATEAKYPAYENNLQDRLWMWGHDPGVYDGSDGSL